MTSLTALFPRATKGDPLIEQATIADDSGLPEYHSHSVIDEHPMTNLGAGVNFYACDQTPQLREKTGQQRQPAAPKTMTESMQAERVQSWIAEQDLKDPLSSRVAVANDGDIRAQALQHPQEVGVSSLPLCKPISFRSMSIVLAPR